MRRLRGGKVIETLRAHSPSARRVHTVINRLRPPPLSMRRRDATRRRGDGVTTLVRRHPADVFFFFRHSLRPRFLFSRLLLLLVSFFSPYPASHSFFLYVYMCTYTSHYTNTPPPPLPPPSDTAVAYRFPSSVSYCLATAVTATAADPGHGGLPQSSTETRTHATDSAHGGARTPSASSFAANGGKPKLGAAATTSDRRTGREKKTLF